MASFTKEMLISDIILRVTKGKPSDDLELEPTQVAFWIDQILPALIKATLDKKLDAKLGIDPDYFKIESCIKPKIKISNCRDCQDNIYIQLECSPINLIRDLGVARVVTEDGVQLDKMSIHEIDNLRNLRFSKPSLTNIKYHRIKNNLYIYGVTEDTMHLVEFNAIYVPSQTIYDLNDDDSVFIGDEILPLLAEELEAIARRQLYQSGIDEENNGKQDLNIQ